MKRLPEKTMMAAIILSCGFVMQADPPEQRTVTKAASDAHSRRVIEPSDAPTHDAKAAKGLSKRDGQARWQQSR